MAIKTIMVHSVCQITEFVVLNFFRFEFPEEKSARDYSIEAEITKLRKKVRIRIFVCVLFCFDFSSSRLTSRVLCYFFSLISFIFPYEVKSMYSM